MPFRCPRTLEFPWMKEPCRSCPEREKDLGGCRCQAYLLTGDATNTDPACALAPHHSVVLAAREAAIDRTGAVRPLVFRSTRNSRRLSGQAGGDSSFRVPERLYKNNIA